MARQPILDGTVVRLHQMLAGPYARRVDAAEADRARQRDAMRDLKPRESTSPQRGSDPLQRLVAHVGGRQVARMIARMREGDGILPSGVVHPDVELAIGRARGGGRALERGVSRQLEPAYGQLGDVRVHTDANAAALARAVSARAFTVGQDVFFGSGEYRPNTRDGDALIAHEVAHVLQQRGSPDTGPMTVSQPGDALEREAEALARDASA